MTPALFKSYRQQLGLSQSAYLHLAARPLLDRSAIEQRQECER